MRLDDDCGTGHRMAGRKLIAREDGGLMPMAVRIKLCTSSGGGEWRTRGREYRLLEFCAPADRLDRNRFHHQLLGLIDESEARFMRRLEADLLAGPGWGA